MGYELLAGTRAPVRVWTDPYGIEPEAAQQLRNIGQLPWFEGVAVMPDVHFGKGATVGSVIAMRQAVSPAAVGVDEIPGAYKDIGQVMEQQEGLVEVVAHLKQVVCVKG